jgi:hypothetical protein
MTKSFLHKALRQPGGFLRTYALSRCGLPDAAWGRRCIRWLHLLREEGLLERSLILYHRHQSAVFGQGAAEHLCTEQHPRHTANYRQSTAANRPLPTITRGLRSRHFDKSLAANIVFADHSRTDSVFSETSWCCAATY